MSFLLQHPTQNEKEVGSCKVKYRSAFQDHKDKYMRKVQPFFFFYPAVTALYEFEPPLSRGSEITYNDAPQPGGLPWTSDQPVAETST